MNDTGFWRGYFLGMFGRFLWFLFISSIFEFAFMLIFGINIFTFWIMSIIISFLINTSLPIKENYPFLRHALILFCVYIVNTYDAGLIVDLKSFFNPNTLWSFFMVLSVIFGVISCFGRYTNGLWSKNIETIGNLLSTILLILSFVFFWWKGGIIYISLRIPLMFFEVLIANAIIKFMVYKYEKRQLSQ